MEYIDTKLKDVVLLKPKVFEDSRGYFFESWNKEEFDKHVRQVDFIQDNESMSSYGVLRGLHYQKGDFSQAKLVKVMQGEVLDVAVDLRRSSPTFGNYIMQVLSAKNHLQMFIPRGFAHGFLVLSETAVFTYKIDNIYAPSHEETIIWNDAVLDIKWPKIRGNYITSMKDSMGKKFLESELFD